MNDLTIMYIVVVLLAVIGLLIVERHFYGAQLQKEKDRLLDEMSKLVKAVISKNANDYVMTTSIDKVPAEEKPKVDPDLVPEDELSDDEFMASINKRSKQ